MTPSCSRDEDTVALFLETPDSDRDKREQAYRRAKAVCRNCPILDDCRRYVLATEAAGNPIYGVAGGLLPSERKHPWRDARPRAPIDCGTDAARRRHRRRGERCDECRTNLPDEMTNVGRNQFTDKLMPCGTYAAARRHQRHGEPLCEPCRQARIEAERQRREARRAPDPLIIDAAVNGHAVTLTRAERLLAVAELDRRGLSARQIAERVDITTRSVERARAEQRSA